MATRRNPPPPVDTSVSGRQTRAAPSPLGSPQVSAIYTMDSEDFDSPSKRKRTGNFFSLINIDCITLDGFSGRSNSMRANSVNEGSSDTADGQDQAMVSHEVTCSICLQDFEVSGGKRPVQLNCLHDICFECESTLIQAIGRNQLRCPICLNMSTPPHPADSKLSKRLSDDRVTKQHRVCAECKVGSLSIFCEDCLLALCSDCDSKVHKPKPFIKHRRNKTEVAPVRVLLTKCRSHFEVMNQFCESCGTILCPSCVKEQSVHAQHSVRLISEVAPDQREELGRLAEESSEVVHAIDGTLLAVAEGLDRLLIAKNSSDPSANSVLKTKNDINAHFDSIISQLEERRLELIRQTDRITEHKVASLQAQQVALSQLLTRSYLAACRGRITALSGGDIAIADSYSALKQYLRTIVNVDLSSTSMREPVVDFFVPEFHGPSEIDIQRISSYGCVGGPRRIDGLSCSLDAGTLIRLRWSQVLSRGRHATRYIEIQMAVLATARDMGGSPFDSDEEDAAPAAVDLSGPVQYKQVFKTVSEAALESTSCTIDVVEHENETLCFRARVVDPDMNLSGPWSIACSMKTPKQFGKILSYSSPFDQSGIFSFMATSGGSTPWSNPIIDGRLVVTASSYGESMFAAAGDKGISPGQVGWLTNPSKGTMAVLSIGQSPSIQQIAMLANTSISPGWSFCTENSPGSWICLDIGEGHLLKLSHYCLRNGAANFQESSLEASRNGISPLLASSPSFSRSNSNLLTRGSSSLSRNQDVPQLPFNLPHSSGASNKCATLRSWHLQGRVREGQDWVTLCVHTRADMNLLQDIPYATAGWKISSKLGIDLYGTLF